MEIRFIVFSGLLCSWINLHAVELTDNIQPVMPATIASYIAWQDGSSFISQACPVRPPTRRMAKALSERVKAPASLFLGMNSSSPKKTGVPVVSSPVTDCPVKPPSPKKTKSDVPFVSSPVTECPVTPPSARKRRGLGRFPSSCSLHNLDERF